MSEMGKTIRVDFTAFRRAAGAWKGTLDPDALIPGIYDDRLRQNEDYGC